jgi:competence protein ComEC
MLFLFCIQIYPCKVKKIITTLAKNRNEMRVEREIAGFAFPFAAGVIAAVLTGGSPCIIKPTYHILALTFTFSSALILLHNARRDWNPAAQWCATVICALSCGVLTGICGKEMSVSAMDADGWLIRIAEGCAGRMKAAIDSMAFADSGTGAVLKALLTGDRSGITEDISETFRISGASHILALSGLHLGIIYGIVSKMLSVSGNSNAMRTARSILIISACGLYTLATGAGASITRAFLFIVLKETADAAGRQTSLKVLLAASLIIHLTYDPTAATDIGFQLSYAAMLGIAYIFPYLKGMWRNNWKGLKWIWNSAALSISCQITTGPLAYLYFGTFPQHFLLTNLLALPLATVIIPAGLLSAVLSMAGMCPDFVSKGTEWMIQTLLETLRIISLM